jgi:hypothetical protein
MVFRKICIQLGSARKQLTDEYFAIGVGQIGDTLVYAWTMIDGETT